MMTFGYFRDVLARVESDDDPQATGDSGRAYGRWQMHPSFYATWGPRPYQFQGRELTWDEAFELALQNFHQMGTITRPDVTFEQLAMAFHLHGQIRWDGWDEAYAKRIDQVTAV